MTLLSYGKNRPWLCHHQCKRSHCNPFRTQIMSLPGCPSHRVEGSLYGLLTTSMSSLTSAPLPALLPRLQPHRPQSPCTGWLLCLVRSFPWLTPLPPHTLQLSLLRCHPLTEPAWPCYVNKQPALHTPWHSRPSWLCSLLLLNHFKFHNLDLLS